jgi:transposase
MPAIRSHPSLSDFICWRHEHLPRLTLVFVSNQNCDASSGRPCEDPSEPASARFAVGRKLLQEKAIAIENDIRGLLRTFELKVGVIGKVKFEDRIREPMAGLLELAGVMACQLGACQSLRKRFAILHRKVETIVRDHEVCRRLMTIPGVNPVVSLVLSATIDIPAQFKNSRAVGPALGLPPVLNKSGESRRIGRVSLCGDAMMRALLYETAQVQRALDAACK